MIALVRRLFLKLRLLVVPGATRSRARAWAVRARAARWRGNCRRHGIRLWVVIRLVWSSVQLVGATTNETTGSSLAGRRRAELRGVRAARVGPPSGTVRSFTASRHFLEMCEFHPTEAAGGRGARRAGGARAPQVVCAVLVVGGARTVRAQPIMARSSELHKTATVRSDDVLGVAKRARAAPSKSWSGASADGSPPQLRRFGCLPPRFATYCSSARGGRRRCTERRFLVANARRRRTRLQSSCRSLGSWSTPGRTRSCTSSARTRARCSPCAAASPRLARRSRPRSASGRCSSSTRSESALLRREHASESALLRRELGAVDRALAQQRAIHRDHARYSALLRSELGAAEADLARAQQHAIDQDLEARVRHRVVLAELDLPSAAAARAPSPAPTPPGLAAAFGRLATAIEAAPLVREQEYKEPRRRARRPRRVPRAD